MNEDSNLKDSGSIKYSNIMASSKYLNCWYTNPTGLTNKLDELTLLVYQSAPDIIFITETWFNDETPTNETELDGYICLRRDRIKTVTNGGGVCIYVRIHGEQSFLNDTKIYKIALQDTVEMIIKQETCVCLFEGNEECKHGVVEQVWCSLTIKKRDDQSETFLLGCVYRTIMKNTEDKDSRDEKKYLKDQNNIRDKAINEIIKISGKHCFVNKLKN